MEFSLKNKGIRLTVCAIMTGILIGIIIYLKTITSSQLSGALMYFTVFAIIFEFSRISTALIYFPKKKISTFNYEPKVTFVIPCKNEESSIGFTIDKCFEVAYPKEKLEVIAINDGSTDGTLGVLEAKNLQYPQMKIINFEKNRGKRAAMAEGFRMAEGEIVVQLDSDSWIEPKTFRKLIDPFHLRTVGAISAHTDPANPDVNLLTRMQVAYYFMSFRVLKAAESVFDTVFCCSGCCSAYRKEYVMPHLKEWENEKFLGVRVNFGDDRALTNRIILDGHKTLYTDEVRAFTIVPTNFRTFLKQQVRWKKGWFINSTNMITKIWKQNPFVALTYFYPLMLITIITPIVAFNVFFVSWAIYSNPPVLYVLGVVLVSGILAIQHFYHRHDKYWPFMFIWSAMNMLLLTYILVYALATIRNNKWGTR